MPPREMEPASLQDLLSQLHGVLHADPFWSAKLEQLMTPGPEAGTSHMAVMVEPFLGFVLAGRKTIESRFSRRRQAPYEQVAPGDLLLLKRSSGPVLGLAIVEAVQFERLTPGRLHAIRAAYGGPLCADDDAFWSARADARYLSLLWLDRITRVPPLRFPRRDRRGWVVFRP